MQKTLIQPVNPGPKSYRSLTEDKRTPNPGRVSDDPTDRPTVRLSLDTIDFLRSMSRLP